MKQDTSLAFLLVVLFMAIVGLFILIGVYPLIKSKPYMDLPEEISLAKPGDTLYIIKNNPDTLELGFRK